MNSKPSSPNLGKVISVRGSVVDIGFEERLPPICSLLCAGTEGQIAIEVLSQLDAHRVHGIALTPTQGLAHVRRFRKRHRPPAVAVVCPMAHSPSCSTVLGAALHKAELFESSVSSVRQRMRSRHKSGSPCRSLSSSPSSRSAAISTLRFTLCCRFYRSPFSRKCPCTKPFRAGLNYRSGWKFQPI